MRILVTGSRNWTDKILVEQILAQFLGDYHTLIHGGSRGLDLIAHEVALKRGWHVEVFPARWDKEGRSAGPKRNARMVSTKPGICVAFPMPDSNGTWDCVNKAREAGIETIVVDAYLTSG